MEVNLTDCREHERKLLPIYPYQGIYGIESEEQLKDALSIMGIDRDKKPSERNGNLRGFPYDSVPYIIHYHYLKTDEYTGYTKKAYHELVRRSTIDYGRYKWRYIREHSKFVYIGFSSYHRYKCVPIEVARKMVQNREKRQQQRDELRRIAFSSLPKTIKIQKPVYKVCFSLKDYEGRIIGFPIKYGEKVYEEKLLFAYKRDGTICFITDHDEYEKENGIYKIMSGGGGLSYCFASQFEDAIPGKVYDGLYRLTGSDIQKELKGIGYIKTEYYFLARGIYTQEECDDLVDQGIGYYSERFMKRYGKSLLCRNRV